ncbi:hypothetical protein KKD52_09285, partial [Myxococcota bacterium]|nr:hypothetical protein [Myxococcota bacterium]
SKQMEISIIGGDYSPRGVDRLSPGVYGLIRGVYETTSVVYFLTVGVNGLDCRVYEPLNQFIS